MWDTFPLMPQSSQFSSDLRKLFLDLFSATHKVLTLYSVLTSVPVFLYSVQTHSDDSLTPYTRLSPLR